MPDDKNLLPELKLQAAPSKKKNELPVLETKGVRPLSDKAAKRQKEKDANIEDPKRIIRQGLMIIIFFFGIMGVWAAVGQISGAVVAPGKIKIETERKTVQHLEGGIVDEILVREGEEVTAGQTLVVLESVRVDADAARLQKQLVSQRATQVRLIAEKDGKDKLVWPNELVAEAMATQSPEVLSNEEKIFMARREALNTQISLLNTQLAQLDAQISGYEDQVRAERTIIATLQEELQAKRQLYKER